MKNALTGIAVAVKKVHEQRYKIHCEKRGPLKGLAFVIMEVFDPGLNQWFEAGRERRPDLDAVLAGRTYDSLVWLYGDESRQEIEENIAANLDDHYDRWLANRPRPDWKAIEKRVNQEYEQRRARAIGRVLFAKASSPTGGD